MSRISIKSKITLWYTLILCMISIITLFVMTSVSREMLINDSSEKLIDAVERTIPLINSENKPAPKKNKSSENLGKIPAFRFFQDGVHTAVYDEDGTLINGSMPFEFADEIEFLDSKMREKLFDGDLYLTYARKTQGSDGKLYWSIGVISIANESVLLESVKKTNLIMITVLICIAALGGYFVLKHAFKPIEKIRNTAKSISESNDLSQRIALSDGTDEIHHLANTFDEMLEKIENTLNIEKQFTSDASHELRTPVAVIASECEYALECALTLEEAKESILSIKKQTDKISKMISELLAISRMDQNTMIINLETVDISELLNFVCDEQEEIHTQAIGLKRNIMPNVYLETDSMLLARIFVNVISNAYSYGKENGNIEVILIDRDSEVVVEVIDDGIGISEAESLRIWERFYQVNPSRTNSDGSVGLGLSIVKIIAEKLGGTITVKSRLGEGSTFTLFLPKKCMYSR